MLKLLPKDVITGCEPPGAEDLPVCLYCSRPAWRVVQVTSGAGARRTTSFCAQHFVEAAIALPVLQKMAGRKLD
jgi:hypothetical protein